MPTKRVVLCGDMQCGHQYGLTPPDWQQTFPKGSRARKAKVARAQREIYDQAREWQEQLQPVHLVVCNGDAVDGKGHRSGGTEQITTDRNEQADMAAHYLEGWDAEHLIQTYGTPYHTGINEDWEDIVAVRSGADKIGGHEWISVNGLVFDCKHCIGSSSIPHGRHTAIARERLWSEIWAERDEAPKSDVIVRSHIHYFTYCGGPDWLGITLPALCGKGSKYGVRQCSGLVDFGLVYFDVEEDGSYTWQVLTRDIKAQRAKALRL